MSESEFQSEQRSSVKVSMTAKGEATVEVKVYTGQDEAELETARQLAVKTYNETAREVRVHVGPRERGESGA